jgi:hypothetical protein
MLGEGWKSLFSADVETLDTFLDLRKSNTCGFSQLCEMVNYALGRYSVRIFWILGFDNLVCD